MFINYLALFAALALSSVSAGFSIVGLTSIFAGAFLEILIMGAVLEVSKLVSISWLYRNWKTSPKVIKYFLSLVVIVLMFLNSAGIFGYLSKAHLVSFEKIQTQGNLESLSLTLKIKNLQDEENDLEKLILLIDNATQKLVDTNHVKNALATETQRHKQRQDLVSKKENIDIEINQLEEKKSKLEDNKKLSEIEIGPIKYIAQLLYNDDSTESIEKAVRIMIILLVLVIDPAAIMLLSGANHGFRSHESQPLTTPKRKRIVEDNVITHDPFKWEN